MANIFYGDQNVLDTVHKWTNAISWCVYKSDWKEIDDVGVKNNRNVN